MNGKYGRDTRSAYEIKGNMTGYALKSQKAARMAPRGNGKSGISAVKFLMETFGRKKASEIIAEVNKEMEKTNVEMNIETDEEDIEDIEDIADKDIKDTEVE